MNIKLKEPKNRIYAIKRIIGRSFKDKEVQEDISKFTFQVNEYKRRPQIEVFSNKIKNFSPDENINFSSEEIRKFSPEEISAKVLSKLKQRAEKFLEREIKKIVITVPVYFIERQKKATKTAGEIAGLEVIKINNEPTAESLAYGFGNCKNDN